jgi:hypothetical protein
MPQDRASRNIRKMTPGEVVFYGFFIHSVVLRLFISQPACLCCTRIADSRPPLAREPASALIMSDLDR